MDILSKLFVRSGQNNVLIKYDGKIIIVNGSIGFNFVIIDGITSSIKHLININTSSDFLQNDTIIDLMQNHILGTDIIVIATKKDATLSLSVEAKYELKRIGLEADLTRASSNYILVGSLQKKYYEKVSWDNDVYFPYIEYVGIGKWDTIKYDKQIRLIDSNVEVGEQNVIGNVNKNNLVQTCALIAKSFNYKLFGTDGKYCYLLNNHNFSANKVGTKYKLFVIEGTIYDSNKVLKTNSIIKCYSENDFKGTQFEYGAGIHNINYVGGKEYNGGLLKDSIKSLIVPINYLVLLTDTLGIRNQINGPKYVNNLSKYKFGSTIEQIVVQNTKYKIIFWSHGDMTGLGFAQSYGKYIIPELYQMKINSININLINVKITLFVDTNWEQEYSSYINGSDNFKDVYHMNNNSVIKSIIIENI